MALPSDYWRNPQSHNVFRTKPCQRLIRSGTCAWGSQCQFSHSLHWPRRPHRGHQYSPELCPHVRVSAGAARGEVRVENACPAGAKCLLAHSKEEVLYHPHILKTCLCEEHANRQGTGSRGRRKRHCHRHYCPFAHGNKELRASPLPAELRKQYLLDALNAFPSNWCCKVCELQQVTLLPLGRLHRGEGRELSFVIPEGPPQNVGEVKEGSAAPAFVWPSPSAQTPNAQTQQGSAAGAVAAVQELSKPAWASTPGAAIAAQSPMPSGCLGSLALGHGSSGGNQPGAAALPPRVADPAAAGAAAGAVQLGKTWQLDAATAAQICALRGISLPPGLDDEDFGPTRIGSGQSEDDDTSVSTPPVEPSDTDVPHQAMLAMQTRLGKAQDVTIRSYMCEPAPQMTAWQEEEDRLVQFLGL